MKYLLALLALLTGDSAYAGESTSESNPRTTICFDALCKLDTVDITQPVCVGMRCPLGTEPNTRSKYEYHRWESESGNTFEIESIQEDDNNYSVHGRYSIPLRSRKFPTIEAAY